MNTAWLLAVVLAGAADTVPSALLEEVTRHWETGQRRAAVDSLAEALAAAPEDAAARQLLAGWQMATHRYEAAAATAEVLEELDPLRGTALYVLARYEQALPLLDPADPLACWMRVDALQALGRLDEADLALDAAARVLGDDHPRILVGRGRRAARAGQHARAIEHFRRALASDATDTEALFGLGRALVRSGEREQGLAALAEHRRLAPLVDALDFARRGVDLDPLHADNHARLGDAERALAHLDAAEGCYRQALQLTHEQPPVPIVLRWSRLLEEDRGNAGAAVALLDEWHARSADLRLLVRAADVLARAGKPDLARQRYDIALALRPGDPALLARRDALPAPDSQP